jgi:hypothetical protein
MDGFCDFFLVFCDGKCKKLHIDWDFCLNCLSHGRGGNLCTFVDFFTLVISTKVLSLSSTCCYYMFEV